jgi:hypothetical protein
MFSSYIQIRIVHVEQRIIEIKDKIEKQRTYVNSYVLKLRKITESGSELYKALKMNYYFQLDIFNNLNNKLKELEKRQELLKNEHFILEKIYSGLMVIKNGKIRIPISSFHASVILNSSR